MTKYGAKASPVPTGAIDDEDIRSLLADIDATVMDLEQRLQVARQPDPPAAAAGLAGPRSAPPLEVPPLPPAVPAAKDGGEVSSFLAELADEVDNGPAVDNDAGNRRARAERMHQALERIFNFFNQLSRHANKLAPTITRSYRLDAQAAFTGLRWHGAFADYRRESTADNARLARVSFRVRLVAPEPVSVVRRWDQMKSFQEDLHLLDLRTLEDNPLEANPRQERFQMLLAPDFPVQISFQGDYAADRIDMLCRNLEGFGISAFTIEVDQVDQKLLDDLGRYLLCRGDTLPAALRRVHHRPKT